MLLEIANEVLHFLTRRDLDKASGVSKRLEAMIAECCEVYPLRPVPRVRLYGYRTSSSLNMIIREPTVLIDKDRNSQADRFFDGMDEAVQFTASVLRHSYVERLELGNMEKTLKILPDQWTVLIDAIRRGAVWRLEFNYVDFSALDNDTFMVAVGFRGLQSFILHRSVVPISFVTDGLIRSSVAKGVRQLRIVNNKCNVPYIISEDAILDFFWPTNAAPRRQALSLVFEGTGVTDMFFTKLVERLLSNPIGRSGSLQVYGAPKQSGLSAYAEYLVPAGASWQNASFHFQITDDDDQCYEFEFCERSRSSSMYMRFKRV